MCLELAARKLSFLAVLLGLISSIWGCEDPAVVLSALRDSRELTADLRVRLSQAADASNLAVMADTDEASIAFARESEQAARGVKNDVAALAPLLRAQSFSSELRMLQEFEARFAEYRKLESRILALAVENTNLKARALSFGAASQAAATFRDSLGAAASSVPPKDRCRAEALVAEAMLALREIQLLHAPHIAERDDVAMTGMEKQMTDLDAKARAALSTLAELAPASARPALTDVLSALDRFKAISTQIVELSRRNTNVLSLELALRKKPALVAACEDRLRALQEALARDRERATR